GSLPWPARVFQKNVDAFGRATVGPEDSTLNHAIVLRDRERQVKPQDLGLLGYVQDSCCGGILRAGIEPARVRILQRWRAAERDPDIVLTRSEAAQFVTTVHISRGGIGRQGKVVFMPRAAGRSFDGHAGRG